MAGFYNIPLRGFITAHAVFGGVGIIAAALFVKNSIAIGFGVGYIIGIINVLWLLRTAAKGVTMKAAKAGRHVAAHYYLRFFATAVAIGVPIYFKLLNAWAPVAGLSVALFVSAGLIIYTSLGRMRREDAA